MKKENVWNTYSSKELENVEALAERYMEFLDQGKTERECVDVIVNKVEKEGYMELQKQIKNKKTIKAGDKLYAVCMNKAIVLFQIGESPMEEGMNILGAHIDSPRLDIKQKPLYEEGGIAYLDTHYYGGIKKYQWVTLPLAIHGVVVKKDGTTVEIHVGDNEGDPVVFISDLLVHLSAEQMEKKANKFIEGEALDIIIGNIPCKGEEKDAVTKNILKLLKETYDMEEEDFISAELEVVPAGKAREAGLDRSMIMAYGQDDRICAYASLEAMLETVNPKRTTCCILVDKEEIGSVGATGMQSRFFENSVAEIMNLKQEFSDLGLRRCMQNSNMLSSDVTAAFDPGFASSFDKKNVAYMGGGIVLKKFTGSRGKAESNDANAEYLARIRQIFDQDSIVFQTAELGKVDLGGGGTIAYILANFGMQVVDCGVALMNMHAPWEVTSKADVLEAKRGYMTFLKEM